MRTTKRRIVIDGVLWIYNVGKSYVKATNTVTNERRVVDLSKLTNMDWDTIEKGKWRRWFHVTPKHIADWLKGHTTEGELRCKS